MSSGCVWEYVRARGRENTYWRDLAVPEGARLLVRHGSVRAVAFANRQPVAVDIVLAVAVRAGVPAQR